MELQRLTIDLFESRFLNLEDGPAKGFSSATAYDRNLSAIFPYFALVSHRQAQELVGVLVRGYEFTPNKRGTTSFAVCHNFRGERYNRDVVLWMSNASTQTLQQHKDLYHIQILDGLPFMTDNPEGE